jgi:hypothetical protein
MLLIAHRGNINGPSAEENSPALIDNVLGLGYSAEIDVWFIDGQFWLGHDAPTYKVNASYLINDKLWCHAKHIDSLLEMKRIGVPHYFWHDQDDCVLTSSGYFWTFPGKQLTEASIAVMPEVVQDVTTVPRTIYGICSDLVSLLK